MKTFTVKSNGITKEMNAQSNDESIHSFLNRLTFDILHSGDCEVDGVKISYTPKKTIFEDDLIANHNDSLKEVRKVLVF